MLGDRNPALAPAVVSAPVAVTLCPLVSSGLGTAAFPVDLRRWLRRVADFQLAGFSLPTRMGTATSKTPPTDWTRRQKPSYLHFHEEENAPQKTFIFGLKELSSHGRQGWGQLVSCQLSVPHGYARSPCRRRSEWKVKNTPFCSSF